jgi:hypothetical protein
MAKNTFISNTLTHQTKFIDPRSGMVLREGSTPMATVGEFKTKGSNVEQPEDTSRLDNLEKGLEEIKDLLKGLTK